MEDWIELTDAIFAKYRDVVTKAGSFADVLVALPELAQGKGSEPLAERLARLTATARGLGDVADQRWPTVRLSRRRRRWWTRTSRQLKRGGAVPDGRGTLPDFGS